MSGLNKNSYIKFKMSTLKARSHSTIRDCDLYLLVMGCIGAGDVVTVAQCSVQPICCDNMNRSRNQKQNV